MENQYLRLKNIIGSKKDGIEPLINISKTAWLNGVKQGIFPQPVRIGKRIKVYRSREIFDFIEKGGL